MSAKEPQDPFATAIEAIYEAALAPSSWPTALQKIADVLGDVGTVMVYGRDDGLFGVIHSPNLDAMVKEFNDEFKGHDLRALRGVERGIFVTHDYATDRDVVTPEEIETHPFYKLMARHGLRYFGAAPIFTRLPSLYFNFSTALNPSTSLPG